MIDPKEYIELTLENVRGVLPEGHELYTRPTRWLSWLVRVSRS